MDKKQEQKNVFFRILGKAIAHTFIRAGRLTLCTKFTESAEACYNDAMSDVTICANGTTLDVASKNSFICAFIDVLTSEAMLREAVDRKLAADLNEALEINGT